MCVCVCVCVCVGGGELNQWGKVNRKDPERRFRKYVMKISMLVECNQEIWGILGLKK